MQDLGDSTAMENDQGREPKDLESQAKDISLDEHHTRSSQGEPSNLGMSPFPGFSSGSPTGSSRSTPERSEIRGILKNRDMRSPVAPDAMNYSGPAEVDVVRDNNYEQEERFSRLVDSRELYARKVRAGLLKKRVRSTSTESAPELTFYPKRQNEGDDSDQADEPTRRPPPSV